MSVCRPSPVASAVAPTNVGGYTPARANTISRQKTDTVASPKPGGPNPHASVKGHEQAHLLPLRVSPLQQRPIRPPIVALVRMAETRRSPGLTGGSNYLQDLVEAPSSLKAELASLCADLTSIRHDTGNVSSQLATQTSKVQEHFELSYEHPQ